MNGTMVLTYMARSEIIEPYKTVYAQEVGVIDVGNYISFQRYDHVREIAQQNACITVRASPASLIFLLG